MGRWEQVGAGEGPAEGLARGSWMERREWPPPCVHHIQDAVMMAAECWH